MEGNERLRGKFLFLLTLPHPHCYEDSPNSQEGKKKVEGGAVGGGGSGSLSRSRKPKEAEKLRQARSESGRDRGAWWAAVHGVTKSRTRLSDFIFTFHFHVLEKEMATHSSIPAWRMPGMERPGGLPYGVSQSRTRLK